MPVLSVSATVTKNEDELNRFEFILYVTSNAIKIQNKKGNVILKLLFLKKSNN